MGNDEWVMFDVDEWHEEVIEETDYARKIKITPCEVYMNVYTGEVEYRTEDEKGETTWKWKDEAWEKIAEHIERIHDQA